MALLLLLVCTDAALTLLHLIDVETNWLRGRSLSLEAEGGPAETLQYVKEFWIALCMMFAFMATRYLAYAVWAFFFLFLLVDDATQLHENVGYWIGQRYGFRAPFGLRPDDIGELLFAGAVGVTTLAGIGIAAMNGPEQSRRISRDLFGLVCVLALFGVVIDALHVITYMKQSLMAQVFLVIEDSGEMIVMSAVAAYAFHVACYSGRARFDLWSTVRARFPM